MAPMQALQHIDAGVLRVAYFEAGAPHGLPVLMMHGFPYDIHAYAEVAPLLAAQGCRVVVPLLRGFGATRFLRADTPRSASRARCSQATTGAAAPPAWWPHCGPSVAAALAPTTATTSSTSP